MGSSLLFSFILSGLDKPHWMKEPISESSGVNMILSNLTILLNSI